MKNFFSPRAINIISLSAVLFLAGFLFFGFYNNWIIFFLPSYNVENFGQSGGMRLEKRDVYLHYWNNKKWNNEQINVLWMPDNNAENIKYLVGGLLNLLEEEKVTKYKVTLQSVLISSSGQQAYLSFDRNPLAQDCSTYEKLMFIEGILKTIRENNINIQGVYFLVHHQVMQDYHLDFSASWPIRGFLS